ncbi:hypothetical protein FEM48_Zijuj10G0176700 [Ziziphus jujuba var. spinosa]|uniref:RRM domain-containing protein n=1 Tax=Ziziphus jujuba var. spinosa TaxID=714518 RepID=A0A978UPT0_ZIZJJ|nr:hypothetical protein FEM48_Zijuj10G0176700 [Ziziphus jujuba var. spinosa]
MSSGSSSGRRIIQELTVQVLNLSPKVTAADLDHFFSYCGNVQELCIFRNKDQSFSQYSALVTFAHPFAFQTALLLDDAILADQPIRVLPALDLAIPIISDDDYASSTTLQNIASESIDILNKSKDMLEENYKVSAARGRAVVEHTTSAISSIITNHSNSIPTSAADWLSDVIDKASKRASGSHN